MNSQELISRLDGEGCFVFGTGFVAKLFKAALEKADMYDCVRGYLVTKPAGEQSFDGFDVRAADDAETDRSALICIAVHESNLATAQETLSEAGFDNTVWVYPYLYDLIYGEPLYRNVALPLEMILRVQNPRYYWLAVRALAAQGVLSGSEDGFDAYIKAQELHCTHLTAQKRYEQFQETLRAMGERGFDSDRPVLIDTNLNIIDGLHRVAAAWALGIERIPCNIVRADDAFDVLLNDCNKMVESQLVQAGLDNAQLAVVRETQESMLASRVVGSPEITIIVPAYNVADYLDQCMESIVAQTFSDFEVLVIDDGSTDSTGERFRRWADLDGRISYLRKPNGGVSPSRNLGIELARGAYLAFVDPDDWLDARYLEKLHEAAEREGAVFAECDIWRYDNRTGKKIHRACGQHMGVRYTLEEHMKYGPTASYKAISRRSLWIDNNVRFPDCAFESPAIYALIVALAGERWAYVPEPLYYYRRFRENSLVETAYAKTPGVADNTLGVEALAHLCQQFKERGLYEEHASAMPGLVAYRLNDILAMQYHRRSAEDFAQLVANQRAFLEREFPQLPQGAYITWGGYNLNKVMQHLPLLNDPSCRFNFSSVVSVMRGESPREGADVHHKNRYRELMVQREVDQAFWGVLDAQHPRFVFMDFIDERFDLLEWDGRFLTCSDAFEGAQLDGVDAASCRRVKFGSDEHELLWRAAFDAFVTQLSEEAPKTQLVIVENYLSERIGTLAGTHLFDEVDTIRAKNAVLAKMYAYVRESYPKIRVIPAHKCENYFTDEAYEYGAVPQHLNDIVNQHIAHMIEEAVF